MSLIHSLSLPLTLAIVLMACDQPSSRRVISRNDRSLGSFTNLPTTNTGTQDQNGDGVIDSGGGTTGDTVTLAAEFKHCSRLIQKTFEFHHVHLGNYNICRSSQSTNTFAIQIQTAPSVHKICAIPTTHSGSGGSTYIGEPQCFQVAGESAITQVNFLLNRPGYQNSTLSGMMIMQDRVYFYPSPYNRNMLSVDAYLFCLNWLAQYGNDAYCTAFKTVGQQQSNYVIHQF